MHTSYLFEDIYGYSMSTLRICISNLEPTLMLLIILICSGGGCTGTCSQIKYPLSVTYHIECIASLNIEILKLQCPVTDLIEAHKVIHYHSNNSCNHLFEFNTSTTCGHALKQQNATQYPWLLQTYFHTELLNHRINYPPLLLSFRTLHPSKISCFSRFTNTTPDVYMVHYNL